MIVETIMAGTCEMNRPRFGTSLMELIIQLALAMAGKRNIGKLNAEAFFSRYNFQIWLGPPQKIAKSWKTAAKVPNGWDTSELMTLSMVFLLVSARVEI
ncbi:TPA: hypothetical protein DEP34_02175 [Candidatus Uhrbacteria bacterium]|nr:hypothetical protein [Candidatus Uhrbacteria bacterium]HCB19169.1 hypothetical protein [Candidatus Uhrbacteria bacterium]